MKQILLALKIVFQQSFYRNVAIVTSAVVAYLSYWLLSQTTTVQTFVEMTQNGDFGENSLLYGITYIVTTLLIIGLSGVSVAVMLWLFNHSKLSKGKTLGANLGGLTAAMVGMGCPVCGAFLLSLLGVAGGLTLFPLQGLELKFLSLGLLTASTAYASKKVNDSLYCEDCNDIRGHLAQATKPIKEVTGTVLVRGNTIVLPLQKVFVFILAGFFLLNQLLIGQVTANMGMVSASRSGFVGSLFGIKTAAAATIIAPKLNADGKTTTLIEQPTITEVPANPNTGDALADAKVVVLATGKPFYAPDDISFDDPINAQNKWGAYAKLALSGDLEKRYQNLTNAMVCSYCCGGPTSVTTISRCGCRHAKAARGFFRYMLQNYGDKYTDEQIVGEGHRWYAIWYPKGMLEDYLLATGKGDVLGHQTHGGAGSDGRHGL